MTRRGCLTAAFAIVAAALISVAGLESSAEASHRDLVLRTKVKSMGFGARSWTFFTLEATNTGRRPITLYPHTQPGIRFVVQQPATGTKVWSDTDGKYFVQTIPSPIIIRPGQTRRFLPLEPFKGFGSYRARGEILDGQHASPWVRFNVSP